MERDGFGSDTELPSATLVERDEAEVFRQINARLDVRMDEAMRRIGELTEGISQRIAAGPQTTFIDPAVGE